MKETGIEKSYISDTAKAELLANINSYNGIISYIDEVIGKDASSEVQKTFFEKVRDFVVSVIETLGYKVLYKDDLAAIDIVEEEEEESAQ